MWWTLLIVGAAQAEGRAGIDWVPTGRADLAAVADEELSGTGLGEFDGVLRPPLTAWAGWTSGQTAWLWGLAAGWSRTVSRVGDAKTVSSRGGLRPSLDMRRYVGPEGGGASPWLQAGVYGTLPWAREASTLYTDEEAEALAAEASADRGRIGGYGVRLGAGVEVGVGESLLVGARAVSVLHQGVVSSEDGLVISTQMFPEVALTVGWRL